MALDPDLKLDPHGHFPDWIQDPDPYNKSNRSASLINLHLFLGGEPLQPPTQQPGPSSRRTATPVRSPGHPPARPPARPLARSPGRSPRRDAPEEPVLTSPPTSDDEDGLARDRPIIRITGQRVGYMNRNDRRKNRLAKAGVYI